MTLEDKIAEIIYQALYFQGTNLSNEVLDAKRNIARRTAKQILANPEIKEAFDYVKLYSEMGDKVDEFADRYEEFKAYKKSLKGIYVECPECKGGVAKYTYTDVGGRRGGGVCLKCKGTGKVQAIPDVKGMVELIHLQEKYIKLLGDEINELAGFASTHYWVSTRYKKGKKLREEIQALTTKQGKLYL